VNLEFNLPNATEIELAVYDLAGRRVALLADGPLSAGRHELVWKADGAPAGVYLVRLNTPGASLTRRVVLER
ncbi:MAG: T9SS type A sorting domain-containing protein, partial [Candidatus Coatesbacteria bacterium]|nr:T9SS type A sorting domain-containing protein [Candidatus Coatesbacteria bacterium]